MSYLGYDPLTKYMKARKNSAKGLRLETEKTCEKQDKKERDNDWQDD